MNLAIPVLFFCIKQEFRFQDLELASGMALGIRSPIPLGAVATQLYRIVQSRGYGQKDFSFVFQLLKDESEKWNKWSIKLTLVLLEELFINT